ncbi:kielin/chordin-like protein isoform X1 [Cephus cinctus]|uniref:Kielin/chordin-like protein isoform X1 n=1 Tax=Cephus cinctus TaxID=211228 RepID=A0AAJ7C538_CEPCN|nr:kielin/chordin-like protein isoform X1 [Cephus cinctus]
MDAHGRTFLLLQVFFCFVVFASTGENKQDCSQVQCPGPLMYYEDVGCTPLYKNEGDYCAYKYNCDHLNARSKNKCYIKRNSYEFGERLRAQDKDPCNVGCFCTNETNSGRFVCAVVDCFNGPIDTGCYMKRNLSQCCPGPLTCPKNESEIPKCVVDGVTYKDGEFFTPKNEPWKRCTCQEGYTGRNIEPFCIMPRTTCSTDLYHSQDIAKKCIPIYYADQNPATSCSRAWRCQNANDTVIPNPSGSPSSGEDCPGKKDMTCNFGNLTMNLGDEINQGTDYTSVCVRCVCEVPPTPTCRRLSDCNLATGRN